MLTVVAFRLIVVPITVLDTEVPNVVEAFKATESVVVIPTPLNWLNNLTSEIVAV